MRSKRRNQDERAQRQSEALGTSGARAGDRSRSQMKRTKSGDRGQRYEDVRERERPDRPRLKSEGPERDRARSSLAHH